MIIHFKTLVSSNIKRKKPWSKVAWIGNLKESVCLFDKSRVSILYLPSGKTKKSISCLQPFKKEIVCFNTSSSGEYIVAVLTNGGIIRWEKDSSHVLRIESSPGVIVQTGKDSSKIHIYINNKGDKVLLVIGNKVNVWDRGRWVGGGLGQFGSSPLTKEVSIDAMFFNNMDQGECCLCTFVFNTGNKMSMFCLFLRWLDHACNDVGFVSTVSTHTFPLQHIHPQCKPIRLRGSYITCISHDGQTVATAVNQRQPHQSKLMFIHPYTAATVVVDLKHLGSKSDNVLKQFAKTYWIAQMSWTSDDVYLACITRRGSLLLLSKLGQPIMIACEGSRVDFGPAHFLPLHPLVEHGRNKHDNPLSHNKDDESLASTVISEKSTRQKFSVSTHPRLPIILCSDGYSVTALQMSEWVRSRDLATISLVEINRDLKSISKKFKLEVTRHTTPRFEPPPLITETAKFKENKFTLLYESFVKRVSRKNKRNKSEENLHERSFSKNEEVEMLAYRFEEDENEATQDETDNDDDSRAPPGVILDADSGKLSFVDLDETEQTLDENLPLDGESLHKLISQCLLKLLSTWGIMTSESHHNTNHANDELHQFFLQTLRCICSTVLQAQQIASCLVWRIGSDEHGTSPVQRTLSELLDTIPKRLCIIASWDAHYHPVVVKSITTAIETILTSSRSSTEGCLSIKDLSRNIFVAFYSLKQCEKHLNLVYSFHLSPLRLVNNRHMTDCFFHSLDVEDFKPTNHSEVLSSQRLMLWQAWRKFYFFLTKMWNLEQCKQILPSLSRVYSTVQKIVLPRSCDRDIIERSTTLSSMRLNLCEYKLNQALRLVARILDDHLVTGSKWSDTNWASVELLCKVMIDYYKDKPIVFQTNEYGGRMIVLDRGVLTSAVSSQRLSAHWSAEHVVSILLCAGRLHEASEFAVAVGAWRVGVALSAVATKVRAFTNDYRQFHGSGCAVAVIDILKDKFMMFLPESIKSEVVKNTEELFDFDPELLYPEVVDFFTVGVMTGSDLSSWVIDLLMNKLKTKLRKLDLLLNDDVHIPTPPMHLPQLNMGEDEDENLVLIRHQLSSLIRLLFVTFHSMGITHLAASWYVKLLRSGESPMSSLSEDKSENLFSSEEGRMVVASLREICGMLWSLHVREKLTEATRAYQRARENEEVLEAVVHDCYAWLSRAKVFAKFYDWDEEIQDLVLCLASELPVDEDLIHIIAEHFHDPSIISAKVDPKMKILMQRMRQTFYNVDGTLQPMTVLYQRLCSELDTQKHHNTQVQHMFMDKHESSHPDGEWYVPKFTESYKASLCAVFPFEKDQCFHEFISQLFDVVLNKASTIQRSGKMKKSEKNNRNILLLCNRHQVATNELDAAFKVRSRQKQFTKIENLSHNTPDATSTPKIRKSTSFNEKPTTKRRNITFQLPNHNNLHRYFSEPDLNGSILDETFDKSLQIPTFDKSKIPQWMKKRLLRLSPYLGWLELWINSQVPTSHTHQPSIRINLTKHQMLQGLTVAELRFGDFPKPISTKKQIFLPPLKIESCVTVLTDDDVTTVSSIASVDVNQNEDQTVNQNEDQTVNQVEPVNETEPVNQTESVNQSDAAISQTVVDQLISTDQSEPQVGQPIQSQGPMETETSEEVTVIEVKDKEENKKEEQEEEEEKGGKKDTTLVLDDLKDEKVENIEGSSVEDFSSELADGGGTYRVNNKNKKPNKDENVADVVRSEINNVLLAQQVSLLSQILLGQTLTGGSQRGGNPLVGNILQSLLPTAPPSVANEPKVEKQEVHEESHKKVHDHVYHMKPPQPKKDFGIPLFHVPGITKSHDPKSAKLISTPNSATSWRASLAAKKTYDAENSPKKPPKLINLKDRKKPLVIQDTNLQHPIRHTLPTNLPYETPIDPPNPTQPVLMKPPTPQHIPSSYTTQQPGPAAKQTYKTQYPILQINPQHPKAPSFNSAPQPVPRQESHHAPPHPYTQPPVLNPPREAWVEGKAPKPIFINCQSQQYPRQQTHRDLIPRLINPQEVLEYESRKHGFTNIKKSSGPTQPRVPLMKVSAPPFEHTGGYHKPQEPPQVTPPMINKENVNPTQVTPQTKPTQPAPPLHKVTQPHEEFHGFIDQDEVRREVEMKMLGSDEKMTGADAHYVATVGKHEKPHKPRMKDADTQMEVEEQPHQHDDDDELVDYRDQMTTKPLQPPPDIFLKLRLEYKKPQEAVERTGFLHIGEVSAESVKKGIERPSIAELHYKATHDLTPNNPGFNDLDTHDLLSQHIASVTKINNVREITHTRWRSSMHHMDAQLHAIDQMARRMNDDFKSSHRLVQAIDNMGEMIAPTSVGISEPRIVEESENSLLPFPSYKPVITSRPHPTSYAQPTVTPYTEVTQGHSMYRDVIPSQPAYQGVTLGQLSYTSVTPGHTTYTGVTPGHTAYNEVTPGHPRLNDIYKSRLNEAYQLSGKPESFGTRSSHSSTEPVMTSQRSNDDVISDLSCDSIVDDFETPTERPHGAGKEQYEVEESIQIEDLINMDDENSNLPVKPWVKRSEEERDDVRRWMLKKRKLRSSEYNEKVRMLRGNEKKPFVRSSSVGNKEIKIKMKKMEERKREMLLHHNQLRMKESQKLIEEIKSDDSKVKDLKKKRSPIKLDNKSRRSPLKEANGRLNSTYRVTPRTTPYKRKAMTSSMTSSRKTSQSPPSEDDTSDNLSIMSTWKVSEDVKRILYGGATSRKKVKPHVTFDMTSNVGGNSFMTSQDENMTSQNVNMRSQDLLMTADDASSRDTGSLLADFDWNEIDELVQSYH